MRPENGGRKLAAPKFPPEGVARRAVVPPALLILFDFHSALRLRLRAGLDYAAPPALTFVAVVSVRSRS